MDVSYVYTVSARGVLIVEALRSIRTLRRFVDKKDITVFFTPPRNAFGYYRLSQSATVRKVDNLSKPFTFKRLRRQARYGEKIHLCEMETPVVVFLDADTTVKKDLSPLLEGDYEFSARMQYPTQGQMRELDISVWEKIFREMEIEAIPMPNAGFMIFKNNLHHRIREQWLGFLNNAALPNACYHSNPKEQTALALALSSNGARISWLTAREHAFKWLNEEDVDTYVLHGPSASFGPLDKIRDLLPTKIRDRGHILLNMLTK